MCLKKKRITVLLGAGVPLNLKSQDGFFPSTKNITNEVLNNPYHVYNLNTGNTSVGTLIRDIFIRSCKKYHPELNSANPDSAAKVHFEILFQILEMLHTYERSWQSNTVPQYVNKFSSFVESNFVFKKEEFYAASRHLLDIIIKCVRKYDDVFSSKENDWYRIFWRGNLKGWDLFNLNYDTTLEQSLGEYEDGYEDIVDQEGFQRFNINKLLKNRKKLSTINHIHGCILYGKDRYENINHDSYDFSHQDLYKWPDADTAYDRWSGSSSSSGTAQDGSVIVQGPIITGLYKTEKVTCLPYDVYRNNFFRCVLQNSSLLIAGYSFSDPYINQIFYRMFQLHRNKTRVVLIDYWDIAGYYKDKDAVDENDTLKDGDLKPRYFEHYFMLDHGNDEMLLFIKRIAHRDMDVWCHFNQLSLAGPMVSDNGCLMLFIGGFKTAIEKHRNEIMKFLKG